MAATRDGALDTVKTVAICGTLLIHVSAAGILNRGVGTPGWCLDLLWGSLLRCAVPLFLMCSGALFLPEEKPLPLKTLWGKYILRIAAALAVWSGAYALWDHGFPFAPGGGARAAAGAALRDWLCFRHKYHLYYLVILLAIYAALPLLRHLAQKGGGDLVKYTLVLWLAGGSLLPVLFALPPLGHAEGFVREYALPFTWAMAGYVLAGDWLRRRADRLRPRTWGLLYLAGVAVTFFGTWGLSEYQGGLSELFLAGHAPGQVLEAAGLYGLLCARAEGRPPSRRAETVSRASFCIYLVHPFFLDMMLWRGFSSALLSPLWSVPLQVALLLVLGLLCWLVLRRVPVVRKYLI